MYLSLFLGYCFPQNSWNWNVANYGILVRPRNIVIRLNHEINSATKFNFLKKNTVEIL